MRPPGRFRTTEEAGRWPFPSFQNDRGDRQAASPAFQNDRKADRRPPAPF